MENGQALVEIIIPNPVVFAALEYSLKYQHSGEGGTRSPPATLHRLQNPKWPPGGPKMADGVWKGVYP